MTLYPNDNLIKVNYGQWNYPRSSGRHKGADVSTTTAPYGIRVVADGCVEFAGYVPKSPADQYTWEWGYHVRVYVGQRDAVRRAGTVRMVFAHNASNAVKTGQLVKAGQIIGVMGDSGNASMDSQGKHVHFQMDRWNGNSWQNLDPTPFIGGTNTAGRVWHGENKGDDEIMKMSSRPVAMRLGPMSGGDLNTVRNLLNSLQIGFSEDAGYLNTVKISAGDQHPVLQKVNELKIEFEPLCEGGGGIPPEELDAAIKAKEEAERKAAAAVAEKDKAVAIIRTKQAADASFDSY